MAKLNKDNPVYYKIKLNKLIDQAIEHGLELTISHRNKDILINFEKNNGDIASVHLLKVGD